MFKKVNESIVPPFFEFKIFLLEIFVHELANYNFHRLNIFMIFNLINLRLIYRFYSVNIIPMLPYFNSIYHRAFGQYFQMFLRLLMRLFRYCSKYQYFYFTHYLLYQSKSIFKFYVHNFELI